MKTVDVARTTYHRIIAMVHGDPSLGYTVSRLVPVDGPCPDLEDLETLHFKSLRDMRKAIRKKLSELWKANKEEG